MIGGCWSRPEIEGKSREQGYRIKKAGNKPAVLSR
jgi:hypothetical protein